MSARHFNQKRLCLLGAYQSKEKGEPAHLDELACETCATEIVKWGNTLGLRSDQAIHHPDIAQHICNSFDINLQKCWI